MSARQHNIIAFRRSSRAAIIVAADAPQWTILDANDAYAAVTHQARDRLVGRGTFEAFPESAETSRDSGAANVRRSFEEAIASRVRVILPVQRYDIPVASMPGVFAERYWELSSAPLLDDDNMLIGVLHEVENVTDRVRSAAERRELTDELLSRNSQLHENAVEMEAQAEELRATAAQLEERTEEAEEARAEAQRAEARVIEVFQQAPAFIAVVNGPEFVFEFANDAYAQLVGHREVLGKSVLDALPEVRGQGFIELLAGVRTSGVAFVGREVPIFLRPTAGAEPELHYVTFVYAPIRETSGAISRIFVHGVDVSEQVRAREAIAASELQLRTLADAIPTLAWTARGDGYIDWYNARWYEYTGTIPSEMEGWGWQTVHDPRTLPTVMQEWTDAIRTAQPFEMTFPLRGADGVFRQFLTRVQPSLDENGAARRWFGTNTDVDAEHRARENAEIAVSRVRRLQSLTAALAAAQTVNEVADVLMTEFVPATGALTGMVALLNGSGDVATIIRQTGLPQSYVSAYEYIDVATYPGPSAAVLRTGQPIFVNSRDGPDGLFARYPTLRETFIESGSHATATLPLQVGGRTFGVMSLMFDTAQDDAAQEFSLTLVQQAAQAFERARLFSAERSARATAEEANMAKMNFLATMSHELRTPLNAMAGYLDLLLLGLRGPLADAQRKDLERMQRSHTRLLNLINDILNYAKIDTGHAEFDIRTVAVGNVIRHVEELVGAQARAKELMTELLVSEPEPVVMADEERLGQILLNLWSNAIKYTASGGAVRVWTETTGQVVRVHVRDTGEGIPADKLTSIFDPFMQVGRRLNKPGDGVGLGLAIAKELAEGMAGSLTVVSAVGEGSTFTLELPAASPA